MYGNGMEYKMADSDVEREPKTCSLYVDVIYVNE